MGDEGGETERKLRSERTALKRALLAERDALAEMKVDAQKREEKARALAEKLDEAVSEKNRLAAVVAQLKQEITLERQAASARITGGSMFNTLLSSADGSTAEIARLQEDVKLLQEQLQTQIKSAGETQEKTHQQRRLHEREKAHLQEQANLVRVEMERVTQKFEVATSELEFVKRERKELQTQMDAKSSLIDELSRKMKNKTEQLKYVQDLREKDVANLQRRYEKKVPFDDSSNEILVRQFKVVPRKVSSLQRLFQLQDLVSAQMKRMSSTWFSLLGDCKREECNSSISSAITHLCTDLQGLLGSFQCWTELCRFSKPNSLVSIDSALARLKSDVDTVFHSYSQFLDACRSSEDTAAGRLFSHSFLFSGSLFANLKRYLGQEPTNLGDAISVLSEIASGFRNADTSCDQGGLELATKKALAGMADILSAVATATQEYLIYIRSLQVDSSSKKRAKAFITRIKSQSAAVSTSLSETKGLQNQVASLRSKLVDQVSKMQRLEADYQNVRSALTAKEKAFQDLEATKRFSTEQANPIEEQEVSGPDFVLFNTTTKDLYTSIVDLASRLPANEEPSDFPAIMDSFTQRIQKAERESELLALELANSKSQQNFLQQDRKRYQGEVSRLEEQLKSIRSTTSEELTLTRANYDNQLQQLTQMLMKLQDEQDEKDSEISRLRAQVARLS